MVADSVPTWNQFSQWLRELTVPRHTVPAE